MAVFFVSDLIISYISGIDAGSELGYGIVDNSTRMITAIKTPKTVDFFNEEKYFFVIPATVKDDKIAIPNVTKIISRAGTLKKSHPGIISKNKEYGKLKPVNWLKIFNSGPKQSNAKIPTINIQKNEKRDLNQTRPIIYNATIENPI